MEMGTVIVLIFTGKAAAWEPGCRSSHCSWSCGLWPVMATDNELSLNYLSSSALELGHENIMKTASFSFAESFAH